MLEVSTQKCQHLVPGKLWAAQQDFVGIDIELQKHHQLSQKYYGKQEEILLLLHVQPTEVTNISTSISVETLIKVYALIGTKVVMFPWYNVTTWLDKFRSIDK